MDITFIIVCIGLGLFVLAALLACYLDKLINIFYNREDL